MLRKDGVWLLGLACLLIFLLGLVDSAPHKEPVISESEAIDRKRFAHGREVSDSMNTPGSGIDNSQDENVKELEQLKPVGGNSLSVIKTHSTVFANINGQKQQHSQIKEEVSKNGEVVARLSQEVDKSGVEPAKVKTALEIPSKNINKIVMEEEATTQLPSEDKRASQQSSLNNMLMLDSLPMSNGRRKWGGSGPLRYSPLDMAEYVFWTGDERGVTSAVEDFLQNGLITREEAIVFLQDIKHNLDYLQTHYSEERFRGQQDKLDDSELSEMRQQMQENYSKKSDSQESPQAPGLYEEDYEELLERLRVADLLYNEYSLEEVIYQLAKLMFTQSLTRGSTETQDALQKFTSFLEMEAKQGRISHGLEKKVLDVLVASLSDTLTEHPELVSTARESLGVGQYISSSINHNKPENENKIGEDFKTYQFKTSPSSNLKKIFQNGLKDKEKKSL